MIKTQELVVIIAVVVLLAAVAVPSYRQYNNRAKMTETMALLGQQLDIWTQNSVTGGPLPGPLNNPSPYVKSIVFDENTVNATLNATNLSFLANDIVLNYTVTKSANVTSWDCTYSGAKDYSSYVRDCSCSDCAA